MNYSNIGAEVQVFNTIKERLIAEFNLGTEEDILWDTLEGQCSLRELLLEMAREVKENELSVEALGKIIADNKIRQARYAHKAQRLRTLVASAMQETGQKKIQEADITISQRGGNPSLLTATNEPQPDAPLRFTRFKTTVYWDKPALVDALMKGDTEAMAIAQLGNPEPILTITTR